MKDTILICHSLQYHVTVKKDQYLDVVIFVSLISPTKKSPLLSFPSVIISIKNITEVIKPVLLSQAIQKDNIELNNGKCLRFNLNDKIDKYKFFIFINLYFFTS